MTDDNAKIKVIATNRKANYEYEVLDKYEAGVSLLGTEVKSLREGKANLGEAYAVVQKGEVWLQNFHINEYKYGNINNHDPVRKRKLLFHKREINKIKSSLEEKGLTFIPLKIYFKGSLVKVLMGIGRGKKIYDKRESIKKRETERRMKQV
jgi:SsrA-binding protein